MKYDAVLFLESLFRPVRRTLATADIRYLSNIVGQLEDLRTAPEKDDDGNLRADEHTYKSARELLTNAAIVSALSNDGIIPYGCASTDSEGGIRIEWVHESSGVRLIVPIRSAPYVYHEVGETFAVEPATAESLARWLREIK